MNKAQLAGAFRVSVNTVDQWIARGCPKAGTGRNGKAYEFVLPDVIEWRISDLERQRIKDGPEAGTLSDAQKEKLSVETKLKELELSKLLGEMISASQVEKLFSGAIIACRARLLSIPVKLASQLLACKTAIEIKRKLQVAVDDALRELSDLPLPENGVPPGDAPVGPAAAADTQSVGGSKPGAQSGKQRGARAVGHEPGAVPAGDPGRLQRSGDRARRRHEGQPARAD